MPRYTSEFRLQVIQAVREGTTVSEAARTFDVSESTVRRWVTSRYRQNNKHTHDCMCFTCFRYRHT